MKRGLEPLRSMATRLAGLQERAKALGVFTNFREDPMGHASQNTSSPEGAKQGGDRLPKLLDELNEVLAA